jgi:serine/threonine protein kinase
MEYLEGVTLEGLVQQFGPLPEGRVLNILQQVCGSLAEAHEVGLIHRDVKPANVILTSRAGIPDFVKVLDFGLVKLVDAGEQGKLTQANVTMGTPYYMSPEAVERPDAITALSDIYAIGGVGYYLLTGTTVFSGKTVLDVCMKQVRAVPDPPSRRLGRAVSPGLEALILRCLAKAPGDRPPSSRALMEELARCEPSQPWTRAEAEAWWSTFRKPPRPGAEIAPTSVGQGATADFSFNGG